MGAHATAIRECLESNLDRTREMINVMSKSIMNNEQAEPAEALAHLGSLDTSHAKVKLDRLQVLIAEVADQERSLAEINGRLGEHIRDL